MAKSEVGVIIDFPRTQFGAAIILLLLGVGLCYLFFKFPTLDNFLTFFAAISAGLGIVYAGYYARITLETSMHRDAIRYSLKLTNLLNSHEITEIRAKIIQEIDHHNLSPKQMQQKINENSGLNAGVNTLLGYLEDVSIAIQTKCADEQTLYRSLKITVKYYFEIFHEYIKEERNQLKDVSLSGEFEKLYLAWRDQKSILSNRKIEVPA
jgi:hypothetical protein